MRARAQARRRAQHRAEHAESAESRTAPNRSGRDRTWISAHLDVVRALVAALEAVAAADQAVPPEAAGGDLWQPGFS